MSAINFVNQPPTVCRFFRASQSNPLYLGSFYSAGQLNVGGLCINVTLTEPESSAPIDCSNPVVVPSTSALLTPSPSGAVSSAFAQQPPASISLPFPGQRSSISAPLFPTSTTSLVASSYPAVSPSTQLQPTPAPRFVPSPSPQLSSVPSALNVLVSGTLVGDYTVSVASANGPFSLTIRGTVTLSGTLQIDLSDFAESELDGMTFTLNAEALFGSFSSVELSGSWLCEPIVTQSQTETTLVIQVEVVTVCGAFRASLY